MFADFAFSWFEDLDTDIKLMVLGSVVVVLFLARETVRAIRKNRAERKKLAERQRRAALSQGR